MCSVPSGNVVHVKSVVEAKECLYDETVFANMLLWMLAKINYLIIGCNVLAIVVVCIKWKWSRRKKTKRYFIGAFAVVNIIWMSWRLQETLNYDIKWRSKYLYLCIFTSYVQYCAEAVILYMFACTSLHRLQAIAHSRQWYSPSVPRFLNASAIAAGIMVGIIISTLNLIALFDMLDTHIKQFCSFSSDATSLPLLFMLVIKALNLGLVFGIPFFVTLVSSIAMLIAVLMTKKIVQRSPKRKNLAKFSWKFLFLSGVIIAFCLAKPATILALAVETHQNGKLANKNPVAIIVEGVMWNLTTLAYMIVTLVGIKYSPKGKM